MEGRTAGRLRALAESGRIVEFSRAPGLAGKELRAAERDLDEAVSSLERRSFKWSTVQSYYSMFHSGRALLYIAGYREKSHSALAAAIELLYVETGRLERRLLDGLIYGKQLRENADYRSDFSDDGSRTLARLARELLDAAKMLVSTEL